MDKISKYIPVILLMLVLLCCQSAAWAKVTATADFNYTNYTWEQDGAKDGDASSFAQRYMLRYAKKGSLWHKRFGLYDISLGLQWIRVDAEASYGSESASVADDNFKLLYAGDVWIAPGGVPFSLHLYSHDKTRMSARRNKARFDIEGIRYGAALGSDIVTEVSDNGYNINSGFDLRVGVKNGHYKGRYRNAFKKYPKLLISYRDSRNFSDQQSDYDQHLRDLAFVSLNKKDNWFHYSVREFEDAVDPSNDYKLTEYLLGTIDHNRKRTWVNLTNWIRLSVDASFSDYEQAQNGYAKDQVYNLNLFSRFDYNRWRANNALVYNRSRFGDDIDKRLKVPLLLNYDRSAYQQWRSAFIYDAENSYDAGLNETSQRSDYYGRVSLDNYSTNRRWLLRPTIALEHFTDDDRSGQAVEFSLAAESNSRLNNRTNWAGEYTVIVNEGVGRSYGDDVFWVEQLVEGSVRRRITPTIEGSAYSKFLFHTGDLNQSTVSSLTGTGTIRQFLNDRLLLTEGFEGSGYYLDVGLNIQHLSRTRWNNRFYSQFEYWSAEGETKYEMSARHILRYTGKTFQASFDTELEIGDDLDNTVGKSSLISDSNLAQGNSTLIKSGDPATFRLRHNANITYHPNRAFRNQSRFSGYTSDADESTLISFSNTTEFSIYETKGLDRKISTFSAEIGYENYGDMNNAVYSLLARADYSPMRGLGLSTYVDYTFYEADDSYVLKYGVAVSRVWPKFSIALRYDLATTELAGGSKVIDEHRWSVDVSKTL